MKAALLLARNTSMSLLVLPGVLAGAAMLWLNPSWLGGWGDTTAQATNALLFLLPLVVVAGAVDSRRVLRPTAAAGAAGGVRPVPAVAAALSAAVAVWAVAGYAVLLLIASLATARVNPKLPPPLAWWWIVAGVAAILAHAAFGVALGRFLPLPGSVAVAGLVGFLANVVLSDPPESDRTLFTVISNDLLGGPFAVRPAVLALQCLLYVGLAAALLAGVAFTVRRSRSTAVAALALALGSAATGTALATSTDTGRTVERRDAAGPRVCSPDGLVCLWRDQAGRIGEFALAARTALDALGPGVLTGWRSEGLSRETSAASLGLPQHNPSATDIAGALAAGAVAHAAPGAAPFAPATSAARAWLVARTLGDPAAVDPRLEPDAAAILHESPDRQREWFRATTAGPGR